MCGVGVWACRLHVCVSACARGRLPGTLLRHGVGSCFFLRLTRKPNIYQVQISNYIYFLFCLDLNICYCGYFKKHLELIGYE